MLAMYANLLCHIAGLCTLASLSSCCRAPNQAQALLHWNTGNTFCIYSTLGPSVSAVGRRVRKAGVFCKCLARSVLRSRKPVRMSELEQVRIGKLSALFWGLSHGTAWLRGSEAQRLRLLCSPFRDSHGSAPSSSGSSDSYAAPEPDAGPACLRESESKQAHGPPAS